jgi:replicative DNA helicase
MNNTKNTHLGEAMFDWHDKKSVNSFPLEGMPYFNKANSGGIVEGSLNVVVAKSGFGKTNYLVDLCNKLIDTTNQRNKRAKILFFTCELSKDKLVERFIASYLNLPFTSISKMKQDPKMAKQLQDAIKNYCENYDIIISDKTDIEDIVSDSLYEQHNDNCNIVIIDHIMELTTQKKFKDTTDKFEYICDNLKTLYADNNLAIIVAAQFRKASKAIDDFGGRGMDDVFGGAMLRSRASLIIYLYCTEKEDKENRFAMHQQLNETTTCHLKFLKARDGVDGFTTKMFYNRPYCQFKESFTQGYVKD